MPELRLVQGPPGDRGRLILPVAIDALGGDKAPSEIVAGARRAHEEHGIPVVLVGPTDGTLGDVGGLEVIPASEAIAMDEDPARAVRTKRDATLVRAAEAVRDGRACAMVSAGNTGAAMAAALLRLGRLPRVARPAIATPLPVIGGTPTVLIDAGANAECAPEWLVQFAQMATAFARIRYGIEEPSVGLLSIGEEPTKGSPLVKEAHALLAAAPRIRFVGNVEGRDLLAGRVDVVVTDGFTGNVALKALEGALEAFMGLLQAVIASSPEARAAGEVLVPALLPYASHVDPEETGGAILLGVDGLCVISHGSSSARAIVNAARVAAEMASVDLVGKVRAAVAPERG
ncbi:MAG TPA: phosphate acyltransferase PlsX [Acidimicrobiales bacterium]|nr:phosphate acyltransferase PlsX [Acidimicrobiales bacterium]